MSERDKQINRELAKTPSRAARDSHSECTKTGLWEGGEPMFRKNLEFVIMAERGNTIEEVLAVVEKIKKAHLNAKIRVEVEV